MAETSKNGIYYNDDENSVADVLADMKKLAESTDKAIEQAKYDDSKLKTKNTEQDTNIQKNTENIDSINKKETEQDKEIEEIKTKDISQDKLIEQLQEENEELKVENSLIKEQIPDGNIVGNSIHIEDSSNLEMSLKLNGGHKQETNDNSPSPDYPSEIETVKDNVIIEICNKNLFDKNNVNKFLGYIDGNGNLNEGDKSRKTLYIKCKANTNYTVLKIISSRFRVGTFKTIENTSHMISGVFDDNSEKTALTINSGDGAIYIAVTYYAGGIDTLSEEEILDSIQIEESSTATDYISHQSQNITIPIQQEMLEGDYIDEVEHHEWGKVVLDGENIKFTDKSGTLNNMFITSAISKFKKPSSNSEEIPVISNYFKSSSTNYIYANSVEGINIRVDKKICVGFGLENEITTVEQANEWLKEHNVILYAPLEEPLDLELTSEQKAIMNQKLYTYKNITNIDTDNELASLDVTYKKDIETEHNKLQNQIDEIKQLISTTETSALLLENLQKEVESEV